MFPALSQKETRGILGSYLFGGREAAKQVKSLSGGEKARLMLAELLQSRPNFLVLDEPTNHMDIHAKETLESAFRAYTGTILFVSHDRYFIKQVADAVMILEGDKVMYYPFGYDHYLERKQKERAGVSLAAQVRAEDQALIAGMRAVPKAERHRLREIPEQDVYEEWKLSLAAEPLEKIRNRVEEICEAMAEMLRVWQESEGFWNGDEWEERDIYETLKRESDTCWEEWTKTCLEWAEAAEVWDP